MKILLATMLLLTSVSSATIPQRWRIGYVNGYGFRQTMDVPGGSVEDALEFFYYVDPGATPLMVCHLDESECNLKDAKPQRKTLRSVR